MKSLLIILGLLFVMPIATQQTQEPSANVAAVVYIVDVTDFSSDGYQFTHTLDVRLDDSKISPEQIVAILDNYTAWYKTKYLGYKKI
jgi:hypothetical protein